MATLNYDPTPADAPEFNESEVEALAIGEKQAQEEQAMYAGKFKDAEALEQAYMELQQKLGEKSDGLREEEPQGRDDEEEVSEDNPIITALTEASAEFYSNDGQLSEETIEKLAETDSKALIQAYLEAQKNQPQPEQVADLTEKDVTRIKKIAGGDEEYGALMEWAASSLPEGIVTGFDSLIASGNVTAISLAVRGLMAEYEAANGYEGRMLSGKNAPQKADVFRSQAEVVQAMQDPRYDKDPAYRSDVFAKLERSNLNY